MQPLNYQVCECDCGITTINNSILSLLGRENFDLHLKNKIDLICFDEPTFHGTSRLAMEHIGEVISKYSSLDTMYLKAVPINILINSLKDMDFSKIRLVIRVKYGIIKDDEHYILVVDADENGLFIFDCYYVENITLSRVHNGKEYNRYISFEELISERNQKNGLYFTCDDILFIKQD